MDTAIYQPGMPVYAIGTKVVITRPLHHGYDETEVTVPVGAQGVVVDTEAEAGYELAYFVEVGEYVYHVWEDQCKEIM